jgi:hypothetical protein
MARVSKIDDGKLRSLVEKGDMTVKEMAAELGATSSCVYARLGVLGLNTRVSRPGKQRIAQPKKEKKSKSGKLGLIVVDDPDESLIIDAIREWATKNADKLILLAGEKKIFYTLTGYMPTQILEPMIDKEIQELQGRE